MAALWTLELGLPELLSLDSEKRLAVLHRLPVFHVNLDHFAGGFRLNLVHQLHSFDNAHHRVVFDFTANPDKAFRRRRWRPVEGPDYGRGDDVQILINRSGSTPLFAAMWQYTIPCFAGATWVKSAGG